MNEKEDKPIYTTFDVYNISPQSSRKKLSFKGNENEYSSATIQEQPQKEDLITQMMTNTLFTQLMGKQNIIYWFNIPTRIDEMNYYFKWWRFYDTMITFANVLVVLFAIYDYNINFSYPRKIKVQHIWVRIIMIFLSMFSIYCVIKRHVNKKKWKGIKMSDNIGIDSYDSYRAYFEEDEDEEYDYDEKKQDSYGKIRTFLRPQFVFDVFLNVLVPYPYLDWIITTNQIDRNVNELIAIEYLWSDIIYILLLFRLTYLIRASINYSIFTDHFANTIAKDYRVKCNIRFALKCIIKTQHIKIVLIFLWASVFILGFALMVMERPYFIAIGRHEFDFITNGMWLVFVTMMTIGFGDFSPMTSFGKYLIFVCGLWGVFISSLIVVCLYGLLDLSNDQFEVFIKIIKSRMAVRLIESIYRFKSFKDSHDKRSINNYKQMLQDVASFKSMRKESKSVYQSNGLSFYNMKMFSQMKKINQRLDKLEIDIDCLHGNIPKED